MEESARERLKAELGQKLDARLLVAFEDKDLDTLINMKCVNLDILSYLSAEELFCAGLPITLIRILEYTNLIAAAGSCATGGGVISGHMETRMMKALGSVQELPGPGEVLRLGPTGFFVWHPEYDSLFIRECYPRLVDVLTRQPGSRRYIVTGTNGIGKSMFFYYLLARLLKLKEPPPFIVWEHMTAPDTMYCYTHGTGEVVVGKRGSFTDPLRNPAAWYICDGVPPYLNCLARTVLLTPPKRETFKGLLERGARTLYLPVWGLDELLECRRLLYDTVDTALVEELYDHYGGAATYALHIPQEAPGRGLDQHLFPLREAVASCDTAQMRLAIASVSRAAEDVHTALHIVVDTETFQMKHVTCASKWVAQELVKKALRHEKKEFIWFMDCATGPLKDMLYQPLMHAELSKGGRFTAVPVDNELLQRGAEEELVFDRCTGRESFEELGQVATEQVYYTPSSSNFNTVDAIVKRGKDTCDFFHVTVGDIKELDAGDLGSMLNKMRLPAGLTPRLHFVVPEEKYPSFRLKGVPGKWPPTKRQRAARVKLYIMKGVCQRLQVSARSGYVGGPMGRKLWF